MSEGRTYVLVGVGAASLVALAAYVATRRTASDSPRVVTDGGDLEEITVTARRIESSAAPAVDSRPRGVRNNNPGNLVYLERNAYLGQVSRDGALGVYDTPHNGLRAMALELRNDYQRKGLRTIDALITEWAPPHENPTVAYINAVSRAMNVPPNRTLNLDRATWFKLVTAIIRQENGSGDWYTPLQIDTAIEAAGVPA